MEHKFTDDAAKKGAAFKTLLELGYSYHGGETWKPPLGQPPAYITWDGEGVPPAGVECEAAYSEYGFDTWGRIQVLFSNADIVVGIDLSHSPKPRIFEVAKFLFRMYETPEERESRRKTKACDAITTLLMVDSAFSDDAARIYDAIAAGEIPGIPALSKE